MEGDPWLNTLLTVSEDTHCTFEDNFIPVDRLPDSAQYIASLERKLKLLGKNKTGNNKDLLESLEEKRQDVVIRLLTENNFLSESYEEENIPSKWFKSYINPEQPLTVGELISLVEADLLAKTSEFETEVTGEPTYRIMENPDVFLGF